MKRSISLLLVLMLISLCGISLAANVLETAVAYMDITFYCGCRRTGLGTMIAENALVTASHNLICDTHSKTNKKINFYFGYKSKSKCFYKYTGSFSYSYYENFSNGFRSEDDIGFVVFPKSIGKKTGWFASSAEDDHGLEWEYSHVIGLQNNKLVEDWNQIDVHSSKQITWPISPSFLNTMEGGPVYWLWEDMKYPTVVAVYTSHTDTMGYARRLTNKIFEDMKRNGAIFN